MFFSEDADDRNTYKTIREIIGLAMRLRNILLVVSDVERTKSFYCNLFGMNVLRDFGSNVILTEGIVLQEQKAWEELTGHSVRYGAYDSELYFEESDLGEFRRRLDVYGMDYTVQECEDRIIVRLCDPDKHLIEVVQRI